MDINQENELLKQMIQSFIKQLTYTKKGKFSQRKYKKNKNIVFQAISFGMDYYVEKNSEEIKKATQEYINKFVDIRDIKLGDPDIYQFEIKNTED
jgi:uncharacterized protein YggL (DUF469 family)